MRKTEKTEYRQKEAYEYPFSAVPANQRKPTLHIMLLLFCFALSTSGIIVGIKVGETMTFWRALALCAAGNFILFLIAYFWGVLGQSYGNTSAIIIKKIFGVQTSVLFSVFVILMMMGWMGMNGEWLADILTELFPGWHLPHPVTTMLVIYVGVLFCLPGRKGIVLVDRVLLPLILLVLVYIVLHGKSRDLPFEVVLQYQPSVKVLPISMLSVVLGNYVVSATCMADICRFAKSKQVVGGCTFLYAVTLTVCNTVGILMVQSLGTRNLTYGVYLLGIMVPGLICSAMITYTTQIVNVYISSLALQNVLKETMLGGELSQRMATFFICGVSAIVGIMKVGGYVSLFSQFLSLCTLSMTGITLVELCIGRKLDKVKWYIPLAVWILGIFFGILVWSWKGNVGVFLIAPLSASILYALLRGSERSLMKEEKE